MQSSTYSRDSQAYAVDILCRGAVLAHPSEETGDPSLATGEGAAVYDEKNEFKAYHRPL